jgi:hypothetical protein
MMKEESKEREEGGREMEMLEKGMIICRRE